MKRLAIAAFVACAGFAIDAHAQTPKQKYERALESIHAFNGAGNGLQQASATASELMASDPKSGYGQTLIAEIISTWQLDNEGQPQDAYETAVRFASMAIEANPALAQPYVSRARAKARVRDYIAAGADVEAALKLDPNLSGAVFMKADLYRRMNRTDLAETWYLKFIEIEPSIPRKSNGYNWMGTMYRQAAWDRPREWATFIAKARTAFEKSIELDPGPWKTVNYANFLNSDVGDFEAAERYAQKALSIMNFPMARYHLAIARYQQLRAPMAGMDKDTLNAKLGEVQRSTGISLKQALDFCTGCGAMHARLMEIEARASGSK